VDRRAKARQQELVAQYGGEQAIRGGAGIGGYTPAPSAAAAAAAAQAPAPR
jgi:hypothetical protein